MTSWVDIPNTDVDAESPFDVDLATAYRDNCIAITEGATGAPRNQINSLVSGYSLWDEVGNTTVGAAVATVDFTSIGTYDTYVILMEDIRPVTDNVALQLQFGYGATPTWITAAVYQTHISSLSATVATYNATTSTAATALQLASSLGTGTNEYYDGIIEVLNAQSTLSTMGAITRAKYINSAGTFTVTQGAGIASGATSAGNAITAFRFKMGSGNVNTGSTIRIYGGIITSA